MACRPVKWFCSFQAYQNPIPLGSQTTAAVLTSSSGRRLVLQLFSPNQKSRMFVFLRKNLWKYCIPQALKGYTNSVSSQMQCLIQTTQEIKSKWQKGRARWLPRPLLASDPEIKLPTRRATRISCWYLNSTRPALDLPPLLFLPDPAQTPLFLCLE